MMDEISLRELLNYDEDVDRSDNDNTSGGSADGSDNDDDNEIVADDDSDEEQFEFNISNKNPNNQLIVKYTATMWCRMKHCNEGDGKGLMGIIPSFGGPPLVRRGDIRPILLRGG